MISQSLLHPWNGLWNSFVKCAPIRGYTDEPYNALLDHYEPGMQASFLETLFDDLQGELTGLLSDVLSRPLNASRMKQAHLSGRVSKTCKPACAQGYGI